MTSPISIGVSSCLLGARVRYDGGHKRDSYIADEMNRYFRLIAICPEVECGMPVPREAMRLEGDPAAPRLMTISGRVDLTGQMMAFCRSKVRELEQEELCGFVFKERSPSCGPHQIDLFASGLFAAAIIRHFPGLPVEGEERLREQAIRDTFIKQVFEYRAARAFPSKTRRKT